jgi:L-galactose dehydrogenase
MNYHPLGNTGLQVSALSYGASPLGSVFWPIDEVEGIRTILTALDRGINLIDVSPFYGLTRAETVLGKALAGIPRDRFYLATKVGRYGPTLRSSRDAPDWSMSSGASVAGGCVTLGLSGGRDRTV